MSHTHYPLHYTLNTTHYLKQRFISVYRPMLGQSAVPALDVKAGKACRTACLRKRIVGSFTSKTRRMRVCPNIGSLSRFMFISFSKAFDCKGTKKTKWD